MFLFCFFSFIFSFYLVLFCFFLFFVFVSSLFVYSFTEKITALLNPTNWWEYHQVCECAWQRSQGLCLASHQEAWLDSGANVWPSGCHPVFWAKEQALGKWQMGWQDVLDPPSQNCQGANRLHFSAIFSNERNWGWTNGTISAWLWKAESVRLEEHHCHPEAWRDWLGDGCW